MKASFLDLFITTPLCDEPTLLFVQLSCSLTQQHATPLSQPTAPPPSDRAFQLSRGREGESNWVYFDEHSSSDGLKSSTWTTCRTVSEGMNAMAPLVEASKHRADLIRVFRLVGISVRSVLLSSSGALLSFHIPQIPCSWSYWNFCSCSSLEEWKCLFKFNLFMWI